jgi:hypothetical protein
MLGPSPRCKIATAYCTMNLCTSTLPTMCKSLLTIITSLPGVVSKWFHYLAVYCSSLVVSNKLIHFLQKWVVAPSWPRLRQLLPTMEVDILIHWAFVTPVSALLSLNVRGYTPRWPRGSLFGAQRHWQWRLDSMEAANPSTADASS